MKFNEIIEELKGVKASLEEAAMDEKNRRRLEALNDAIHKMIMYSGSSLTQGFDMVKKEGREEAWELAKKVARGEIDFEWIKSLGIANPDGFGWMSPLSIGIPKDKDIPINELLESYNTWEKNRTIKRWDEVYSKSTDLKFVVTRIASEGKARIYEGFNASGGCYEMLPTDVVKTGRSFPELAAVIERMNKDD